MSLTDSFEPRKDLLVEKFPDSPKTRTMRCIPCNEVIYEATHEDSKVLLRSKWNKMALHLSLMHGCQILSDSILWVRNTEKPDGPGRKWKFTGTTW